MLFVFANNKIYMKSQISQNNVFFFFFTFFKKEADLSVLK